MQSIKDYVWYFIRSSQDKQKVSLTIKGLIAILALMGFNDVSIDLLGNSMITIIGNLGIFFSSLVTLWGLLKKVYAYFGYRIV